MYNCKECIYTPVNLPEYIQFKFSPEIINVHIGDTLLFESELNSSVFPTVYQENTEKISSQITAIQFCDTFPYKLPAAKSFLSTLQIGRVFPLSGRDTNRIKSYNIINFSYVKIDSMFQVKASIIPVDTGYFGLEPYSYIVKVNIDSDCEENTGGLMYYHNDSTHVEIKEHFFNQIYPDISRRQTYCIHVLPKK